MGWWWHFLVLGSSLLAHGMVVAFPCTGIKSPGPWDGGGISLYWDQVSWPMGWWWHFLVLGSSLLAHGMVVAFPCTGIKSPGPWDGGGISLYWDQVSWSLEHLKILLKTKSLSFRIQIPGSKDSKSLSFRIQIP